MQFHYALVDDLMSRDEFERRVEEKIQACGDLVDEPTAAMMVVRELGRQHVKLKALSGRSSLFSFFCKVIAKRPPREFEREGGERGLVAGLFVGDDTGSAQLVFWDDRAMAVEEIEPGDVLEIIGRHAGKNTRDITVMAIRKADCDIPCTISPGTSGGKEPERVDLRVRLIAVDGPRAYTRRDGTPGEMAEAVVGDATGTARLVAWAPGLLHVHAAGSCISITGAKPRQGARGREYSLDDAATVAPCDEDIPVPFMPLASLARDSTCSVRGVISRIFPIRSFTTRDGAVSQVRNLILTDGDREVRIVLWRERAFTQLLAGDTVEVYNARAKAGRDGGTELHAGPGSAIVVECPAGTEITFEGTCLVTADGTFIDNGTERYLVNADLPHGQEMRITGACSRNRITPQKTEPVSLSADELAARLDELKHSLGPAR
jgi:replication factor A1